MRSHAQGMIAEPVHQLDQSMVPDRVGAGKLAPGQDKFILGVHEQASFAKVAVPSEDVKNNVVRVRRSGFNVQRLLDFGLGIRQRGLRCFEGKSISIQDNRAGAEKLGRKIGLDGGPTVAVQLLACAPIGGFRAKPTTASQPDVGFRCNTKCNGQPEAVQEGHGGIQSCRIEVWFNALATIARLKDNHVARVTVVPDTHVTIGQQAVAALVASRWRRKAATLPPGTALAIAPANGTVCKA